MKVKKFAPSKNEEETIVIEEESCCVDNKYNPNPDTISYYALEEKRRLYIDYDIAEDLTSVRRMIERWNLEDVGIPKEERKPIWLEIMSYGGYSDYCFMLIDAIETSVTPVYTVNIGVAASAGGLIFIAGHKRFMHKRAKIVIHEGSTGISGDAQKVLDATDSYKKVLKQMKDFIIEKTNITMKELNKKKSNDWELDSQYCLEHGVCEVVIESIEDTF